MSVKDSRVREITATTGPGVRISGLIQPSLLPPILPMDLQLWAGLVDGRWKHPNVGVFSEDGALFSMRFGIFTTPARLRFSNPRNVLANLTGGHWRMFDLPIPFGTFFLPIDEQPMGGTIFLPREV